MKILPISLVSNKKSYVNCPINPTFTGLFRNKGKDSFEKSDMNDYKFYTNLEDEVSDDINELYASFDDLKKTYTKYARQDHFELTSLLKIGASKNFQNYMPYGKDKKVIFSNFDKSTNTPRKVDIVDSKDVFRAKKSYEFESGSNYFTVTNHYDNNSYIKYDVVNKQPINMYDFNYKDLTYQHVIFLKDEIVYKLTEMNKMCEPKDLLVYAKYDHKNLNNSYCVNTNEDKGYILYNYNKKSKSWHVVKELSKEELPDYVKI